MKLTCITLTHDQHKELQPLFDKANVAYAQHGLRGRGVIFAQIRETDEVQVKFVPAEIANKVVAILREMSERHKT